MAVNNYIMRDTNGLRYIRDKYNKLSCASIDIIIWILEWYYL